MNHLKATPKDFFLYLLSGGLLYYCTVWFILLLHQYIDYWYPNPNAYYSYYVDGLSSTMRWAIASLIVGFPIYILVTRYLNKDTDRNPDKRELWVRRWLMYLTLFFAAITIIIDIIYLIFNFLEGDFALRFVLKALAILATAKVVFGYYFYELRRDAGLSAPGRGLFRWTSIILVVVAVLGAFFVVGSPTSARQASYDRQRVIDLENIQWQIINHWQSKEVLPADLASLNDSISGFKIPKDPDPESESTYTYSVIGPMQFELCATFSTNTTGREIENGTRSAETSYFPVAEFNNWMHEAGETCFERTIDPDLYRPFKGM